ncbi:ABC-F family ATP-binding cassette domain-containing protein [Eubacterium sp.]|jgi:ATP-binding cassette subfamily F protein 3|uniref:ABC transporter ATP-binding protein n=1 Tax=Eubacterium sp. TaxID=142586 RepID=UPI001D716A29|nr:ABC-F family ATP-binding cassette domain-containing protein [Eubacterium sp.]MBS5619380.1 ABC-F family ATP-binding cassette domain-containing protein [Eubacterium sp.]
MILSCNHISKSYGVETILNDCSFFINDNEKAAIVGNNGAGKSTIMKIIMGELSPDDGNVIIGKDKTIGYLAQYQDLGSNTTIYEEVKSVKQNLIDMEQKLLEYEKEMAKVSGDELSKLIETYTNLEHRFQLLNGYSYKSEIEGVIKGLGFTENDFNKSVGNLSGGQKTRVALCKLLLEKPDIIMLDEPTNHLDLNSIKWLETYLLNYNGAVLIIAHDRYFLDKIVSKVIEIENHKAHVYSGNYSDFAVKKQELRVATMNAYLKQQSEIKHQEEVIAKLRSYKQEKFYKRAESREKQLEKMDLIEKPEELKNNMTIKLEPDIVSGNDVLSVENLEKSYNTLLFKNISFEIKRGEHVAIIGDNGTGKTTILKIINGLVDADSGMIKLGTNVHIGYYDQEQHNLTDENTLFEEIANSYPNMTNTKIRNTLAAFMFTGEDVFKRVSDLSGGEKGRLSLAKLMLSEANLIILDEPTNHLDMASKEILENAINNYTGTVLYVSHDRYFINQTANRILELTNTKLINYLGNYDYYEEKKEELTATFAPKEEKTKAEKTTSSNKQDYLERKAEAARIRKLKNDISKVEEKIKKYEDRLNELDEMVAYPSVSTNSAKLNEIGKEQNEISDKLDKLMEEWEILSDQL